MPDQPPPGYRDYVDHIDGNPYNNDPANLRIVRGNERPAKGKIVAVCSLCGHEYARWFDEAESAEHMAEAHDMRFMPGSPRPGDPPRWVTAKD